LATAVATLRTLRQGRSHHAPTRLLQQADYLTGYTGVIAHLNNADRRIANWQDFFDLVRDLEQGSEDLFGTVRRLKRLFASVRDRQSKVEVKPQRLSAGNAVTLITIHSAKGLEWPIVFLSNLDYKPPTSNQDGIYVDPELGVALKSPPDPSVDQPSTPNPSPPNRAEDPPLPARYRLLQVLEKQRDRAELARLLYVGLTRARDRLILTSAKAEAKTSAIALLESGFNAARLEPVPITASPTAAERCNPVWPEPRDLPPAWVSDRPLIGPVSAGIIDLDVTSLSDYHYCPQRFRFAALDRHPGAYDDSLDGITHARRTGLLTHAAIEHFGRQPAALESAPTLDELQTWIAQSPDLGTGTGDRQLATDAATFAHRFFSHPAYAPYRTATARPEQSLQLTLAGLTLNGRADWVGEDFVLEFKTGDRTAMTPAEQEGHALQVWAYAQALGKTQGAIAYLRSPTGDLETLTINDPHWRTQAETLARAILHQNLDPTPEPDRCKRCPYHPLCPAALAPPPA
jgi:ATP-dependent helicase/nuclease subunit A